jgi:hypothetical protein
METIEVKLYSFDELSDDAKQKAIEEYREGNYDFSWGDEWLESVKKGLDHFDVKLKDYSIDWNNINGCHTRLEFSQDDNYGDGIENLSYVRLWKYINAKYLKIWSKYGKKYVNILDGDCPFTGYCGDCDFLNPIREFIKKPKDITFRELIEDCVYEALKGGCNDYEYQNSDEAIIESIEANDYNFTEAGKIY